MQTVESSRDRGLPVPDNAPEEMLYFDERGIDELSNQLGAARLESFSKATETSGERGSAVKPKIGLGAILKALGAPSLEVEAEANFKRGNVDRATENYVVTRESRYRKVIESLGGSEKLEATLYDAWKEAKREGSGVFCLVRDTFEPVNEGPDRDWWLRVANENRFLQLTDSLSRRFLVGMSFEKINNVGSGRINSLSHLAIRLRAGARLQVFGKMNEVRYIKPFVVSWS